MTPEERAERLLNDYGINTRPYRKNKGEHPMISYIAAAIAEAVEAERAARGRIAAMGLDDPLPCDVLVAPATLVRKGSPLLTLLTAIIRREGRAAEDTTFSRDTIEARGK